MGKGVLRNFTKFTRKHLCQSFRPATLLNKRLWHRCFTVNFAKISLKTLFTEHLWTTACEFITETLIFRSSRLQMFFKVSVLKNFAMLGPLSNNKPSFPEHLWWLLLNLWGSKYFFVAEHGIYCWQSHWFRSSHQRCSVRKGILRNFAKLTGKHKCQGLFFNKLY